MTLSGAAGGVAAGVPLRMAVADFLDDLRWIHERLDVASRINVEPQFVDAHVDAYFGALAEHVATSNGIPVPPWSTAPARFLDHFWWPSRTEGLHARALVESPAAFRRRGIFIGRTTLQRV